MFISIIFKMEMEVRNSIVSSLVLNVMIVNQEVKQYD
jgi:hypothetical protein